MHVATIATPMRKTALDAFIFPPDMDIASFGDALSSETSYHALVTLYQDI
jgi:hypothetical protein